MLIPLYLIAPSGYADQKKAKSALAFIQKQGFKVLNPEILSRQSFRFAGSIEERLTDFNWADLPEKTMVMAIRGGYGLHQLLDQINYANLAENIQTKRLFLVGHSDFTALQMALYAKTGVTSFAGPMLASDFYYAQPSLFTLTQLKSAYASHVEANKVQNVQKIYVRLWKKSEEDFSSSQLLDSSSNAALNLFFPTSPLKQFNPIMPDLNLHASPKKVEIEGVLWGGNLSIVSSLLGSEYFPRMQQAQQGILYFEDIAEAVYRVDRMLHQLYHAGVLTQQKALVFGQFTQYTSTEYDRGYHLGVVLDAWQEKLAPYGVSIYTGLMFGHTYQKTTLGFGLKTQLYAL